jgi:hypothetical protein
MTNRMTSFLVGLVIGVAVFIGGATALHAQPGPEECNAAAELLVTFGDMRDGGADEQDIFFAFLMMGAPEHTASFMTTYLFRIHGDKSGFDLQAQFLKDCLGDPL